MKRENKIFLNDQSGSEELHDWHIPPDFVFDNAMAILDKRKKRRRILLLFFFIIVGFIPTGLWLHFTLQNQHVSLQNESLVVSENNPTSTNEVSVDPITISEVIDNIATQPIQYQENKTTVTGSRNYINNLALLNPLRPFLPAAQFSIIDLNYGVPGNAVFLEGIDKMPAEQTYIKSDRTFANLELDTDDREPIKKTSLGLSSTYILSKFTMDNIPSNAPNLSKYDDFYSSFGLNLDLNRHLSNKWNVFGSLEYANINNKSLLVGNMPFEQKNVYQDNTGNLRYATDVNVETPLGGVMTRSDFALAEIPERNIDYESQIDQSFDIISLSLGIRYNLVQKDRWMLMAETGIGGNYILSENTHSENLLESNGAYLDVFNNDSDQVSLLCKKFFHARVGLNAKYNLSDNLSLTTGVNYMKSISSLREAIGVSDPTTDLHRWSTHFGLSYGF